MALNYIYKKLQLPDSGQHDLGPAQLTNFSSFPSPLCSPGPAELTFRNTSHSRLPLSSELVLPSETLFSQLLHSRHDPYSISQFKCYSAVSHFTLPTSSPHLRLSHSLLHSTWENLLFSGLFSCSSTAPHPRLQAPPGQEVCFIHWDVSASFMIRLMFSTLGADGCMKKFWVPMHCKNYELYDASRTQLNVKLYQN